MVDQDVGVDVCANFGDARLKPLEASFSAHRVSKKQCPKYFCKYFAIAINVKFYKLAA